MGDFTRFKERLNKWRYTLVNGLTSTVIPEPIGWDNIRLTLTRSATYKSLFRGFSASLEFYHDAYDAIVAINESEGVQTETNLKVEKVDTNTGEYTEVLNSKMDFVDYTESSQNKKSVKVPLVDSAFNEKIKAREDISIPVDRPTDLDDNTISAIEYQDIELLGREFGNTDVPSYSWLDDETTQSINDYNSEQYLTATESTYHVIRVLTDEVSLNPNYQNVAKRTITSGGAFSIKSSDAYYYNEIGTSVLNINFSIDYDTVFVDGVSNNIDTQIYWLKCLFDDDGGINLDGVPGQSFPEILDSDLTTGEYESRIYTGNLSVELSANEGVVLFAQNISDQTIGTGVARLKINEATAIKTTYSSEYEPTSCKVVMPFEAFSYIATAITGEEDCFRSNYFGRTDLGYDEDGEGALVSITNGLLIRQFAIGYEQVEDGDRVAQLAFNFKELFENHYKKDNIGIQIIIEDGKTIIVAEKQSELYSYDISHTVSLIEKGSFNRIRNIDNYYSNIEAGYVTAPDDLLGGLEEYISKIEHSTKLSFVQNTLDLVCTYSAISSRIEKQRRKPALQTSTEEMTGDNTIFFIELWRDTEGNLVQRNEQGFDDIIGLDGLDTKLNLGITPKQILLNHGNEINVGLQTYPTSIVKYNTSDKTTDLQLLKTGETDYIVENLDIVAGSLADPLWTGYNIEFNSVLGLTDYFSINDNPNNLIQYTSPLTGDINFGWVIEIGTDAVDKDNNMTLKEANPPDVATRFGLATNNENEGISTVDNELIEVI